MKKFVMSLLTLTWALVLAGCMSESATQKNVNDTKAATETLTSNQQTPTDIEYSLERFNLIKRAYWVNGQHEKANAVPCPVERPIGYIICYDFGAEVFRSTVDGKISSLNSYLSPDSEYYERTSSSSVVNHWLADVDGSYGENSDGIFWFDASGHYHEWNGKYHYSDIPFEAETPVLNIKETE